MLSTDTYIRAALDLAQEGLAITPPNPSVGCLIVNAAGIIVGRGHTQAAGGAHAEIMALRNAQHQGHDVNGATAYVTLEPCSHHGRTGPCCHALIAAGIQKVVASMADPNPLVSGQGFKLLRAAGVQVEVGPGAKEAREINLGFLSRMVRRTPWVRLKIASSLDGTTALHNGASQWITSPEARTDGHAWRARASAVLTGIGTVLQDNPRLDVRLVDTPRQPHRIIVDSQLQTPADAAMFDAEGEVWIYSASDDAKKSAALKSRGAKISLMASPQGKVDLPAMLRDLAQREVNELHVEAGQTLNGALLGAQLVDELLLYMAPTLLGPGRGMAALPVLDALTDAQALQFVSTEKVGPDLRVLARITGRDVF